MHDVSGSGRFALCIICSPMSTSVTSGASYFLNIDDDFIAGLPATLTAGLGAPGLLAPLVAFIGGLADDLLDGAADAEDGFDFDFFFDRRSPSESEPDMSSASLPPF